MPTDYNHSFRHRGTSGPVSNQTSNVRDISRSNEMYEYTRVSIGQTILETLEYLWDNIIEISLLRLLDGVIVGAKDELIWNHRANLREKDRVQSGSRQNLPARTGSKPVKKKPRIEEIPIPTKLMAYEILDEIERQMDKHDALSRGNVYDILSERLDEEYTPEAFDWNVGWTSCEGFDAEMDQGSWYLVVPKVIDIRDY